MSKTVYPPKWLYRLYEGRLLAELEGAELPGHVAVILDGNRRWAKRQNDKPEEGHRAGALKVSEFLQWCDEFGIKHVTLYLLSLDNLKGRSHDELHELFSIIDALACTLSESKTWRLHHVGSPEQLPHSLVESIDAACAGTQNNTGLNVNLAIGYGGRVEIIDAIKSIACDAAKHGESIGAFVDELTPELISEHLYTRGQPDPDLVLRTSGEQRLSDFLLWQSAHSELYFADVLWPDFRRVDFVRALRSFAQRSRRYGS